MASKKKPGSKMKPDDAGKNVLTKSLQDLMKTQNANHADIGEKIQRGDIDDILSVMPAKMQTKQKQLQNEAKHELNLKLLFQKLGLEEGGRMDDGDQSMLKGDKAQVLRNQWGGGMDYNPAHPRNSHLSPWLRALWRGDYQAVMQFIDKLEMHEISNLLEVRESLLNVSAVFHVIIGAMTLCGKNPLFRDIQISATRMMEVKNEHEKILSKLLELGANIDAKDVAGYTPLHHCLTSYSNQVTLSMAKRLLVAGADPNLQNRFGCTALWEPVMAANLEAVMLLLEFGADPDIKEYDAGISCRYTATFLPKVVNSDIYELDFIQIIFQISKLFSQVDKRSAKKTRAKAKVEAGGSLRLCKVCGVDNDNKRSTGCYMVWYCGQKCQAEDWSAHKHGCKETKAQYKKVVLVEHAMAGRDNITKEMYVHKIGDIPSKKHFVVKVQVALGQLKGTLESPIGPDGAGLPLFVYNRDRSLCGYLHREGAEEEYDMLLSSIKEKGFNGMKGFFYAIYSGEGKSDCKGKKQSLNTVAVKMNTVQMLPVEKW